MLKIIARILIVLLVAGALGAGIYALGNSSAGQSLLATNGSGFGPNPNFSASTSTSSTGATTQSFQSGSRQGLGGHDGAAGGGLDTVAKNLGLMALITAGVVVLQKLIRLAFHRSPLPAS